MPILNSSNVIKSEEVYLDDYKEFIKIDNLYYGGNQAWLSNERHISKYQSDRSCGVIAATNTILYMSRYNSININHENNISKQRFLDSAMSIYKFLTPKFYGIPTISIMSRALKNYAHSNNFQIKTYKHINPTNLMETVSYINKAISNNCPVLMVTWNTKIENLKNHWVTITGYYRTINGENFVIASNWGREEVFSLDKWIRDKSFYKGMLYINIGN